jgi:hypothetical protein
VLGVFLGLIFVEQGNDLAHHCVHRFALIPDRLCNGDDPDAMLIRKRSPSQHGGSVSAAEVEEESRLRASMADRVRAIGCPAGYGERQRRNDSDRLHQLNCKRLSPRSCGGGTLTNAEDAEEAQLMARLAAYHESPEGRARSRIFKLELQTFAEGLSTAEQNELDSLRTLYPDLPLDANDPIRETFEAFAEAVKGALKPAPSPR